MNYATFYGSNVIVNKSGETCPLLAKFFGTVRSESSENASLQNQEQRRGSRNEELLTSFRASRKT